MTQIRTAEEILTSDKYYAYILDELPTNVRNYIIQSHMEYAKQFIDLVADEAEAEMRIHSEEHPVPEVIEESILKIKDLIK